MHLKQILYEESAEVLVPSADTPAIPPTSIPPNVQTKFLHPVFYIFQGLHLTSPCPSCTYPFGVFDAQDSRVLHIYQGLTHSKPSSTYTYHFHSTVHHLSCTYSSGDPVYKTSKSCISIEARNPPNLIYLRFRLSHYHSCVYSFVSLYNTPKVRASTTI